MENNLPIGADIHQTCSVVDSFVSNYLAQKDSQSLLTGIEGMTLRYIYHQGRTLCAQDIMEFTHVSKATASQTLNSLLRKELIVMKENPEDKRCKKIDLTDKGKEAYQAFAGRFEEINSVVRGNLTEAEIQQLHLLLAKIRDHVMPVEKKGEEYGKN